jgi:hypothetical protein
MVRFLASLLVILSLAAAASAGHRAGLFGRATDRVVVRERHVERTRIAPVRALLSGGGCIGTVRGGGRLGRVGAGCSGYAGPAMVAPAVKVVPSPMPKP